MFVFVKYLNFHIFLHYQLNGGPTGYAPNGGIEYDEFTEETECCNVSYYY